MTTFTPYKPGKKAQYNPDRWQRYEKLRGQGFSKTESRQLSSVESEQGLSVVQGMVTTRQKLLRSFRKEIKGQELRPTQAAYRWNRFITNWYGSYNFTSAQGRRAPQSEGGKPDLFVWYNRTENTIASGKGWRKGAKDTNPDAPSRRPLAHRYPDRYKGDVAAQRKRYKARSKMAKATIFTETPPVGQSRTKKRYGSQRGN